MLCICALYEFKWTIDLVLLHLELSAASKFQLSTMVQDRPLFQQSLNKAPASVKLSVLEFEHVFKQYLHASTVISLLKPNKSNLTSSSRVILALPST